jgi:glycosyltransferase involved in cell wall biosynthesis
MEVTKDPTVSIITVVYNAEATLERTILSVTTQNNSNFEYIIIDGGSTDKTLSIIKKYEDKISYWISEPDKGIYDAWNKGIKKASGDWIMFLGADDILLPGGLNRYFDYIRNDSSHNDLDYISSRVKMIDSNGNQIWINGWKWEWPKFLSKMTVAHPGSFHSRRLFERYGDYNINYRITGDYELLLRPRGALKAGFFNEITVAMTEGGTSDSINAIKEHCKAAIDTGGGNFVFVYLGGAYVLFKSKLNKLSRKFGINLNIIRPPEK